MFGVFSLRNFLFENNQLFKIMFCLTFLMIEKLSDVWNILVYVTALRFTVWYTCGEIFCIFFFCFQNLKFSCKKMVVDSLIYTVPSGSLSTSTNTTSLVMQTSQTSETPFRSVRERIVDHILQLKLSSAKILSKALSNE